MIAFGLQKFAGEPTERATPKRRREVRAKGNIPKSAELTSSLALLAILIALKVLGSSIWSSWHDIMSTDLGHIATANFTEESLMNLFISQVVSIAKVLLPVLGAAILIGMGVSVAQTGVVFLPRLLVPDFNRINPFSGLKRMFSVRSSVESAKSLLKLCIIGGMCYLTIQNITRKLMGFAAADIRMMPAMVGNMVFQLAIEIASAMVVLAMFDLMFQRWQFERSIRMSKEDVKEEMKQMEGNPLIKAKVRQRGRELARRRMIQEVPKADVVITNPTHYSVAIQYQAGMSAPVVLAKGVEGLALRIREVASEADVPLVENRPLARALYRTVEIGDSIPPDLFQAVAEVLAYVYRLRNKRVRG